MTSAVDGESANLHNTHPPISESLVEALLDETPSFGVDWSMPARLLDEESRFMRLARVKALLPADNIIEERSTHDATLENHIRLALQAAGDTETLGNFLELVSQTLAEDRTGRELLAQQVFWIWAPAAEIAGLYHLKTELEESAFEVLFPDECQRIREMFEGTDPELLENFLDETRDLIFEIAQPVIPDIKPEDISARRKSYYSIWRKCKDKGWDYEVSDFVGFRVVIDIDGATEEEAVGNCYAVVGEICGYFEMDSERFKDYIAQPKPNGYRSLHLTLYTEHGRLLELQVRTRAMHEAAESNTQTSHLLYDATHKVVPGKEFRTYRKVPALYVWREEAARHIRESDGSTEVLENQILFFRPDGNLYIIEAGATALDGAFRIHNKRALRAETIYVNNKPVEFGDPLSFGDLVDVQNRPYYPTDHLQVGGLKANTVTQLAHKAIEHARRGLLRDALIAKGKEIVIEHLGGNFGLKDPFSLLDDEDRRYLAERAGVSSLDNLLFLVGMGNRSGKPTRVANLIKARLGLGDQATIKLSPERLHTVDDAELLSSIDVPHIGGRPDCRVAGCCSQKIEPGDPVVARPIRYEGLMSLHRADCINVRHHPGLISCNWI